MSPGTKKLLVTAALLLCATPARAQMMMMPMQPVVDARRALHLLPAMSWKDGFFLEHTGIPDIGLHPRLTVLYSKDPLGSGGGISDRVALYPSLVLSIVKWVDLGLQMPIALWQDNSGFNVSATALGDLRLLPKLSLASAIPEAWPKIAVSLGVGFPTGNAGARLSAGQVSFSPKLIVDWSPQMLKKRVVLVVNLGGFLAGTGGACNPNEQPLDPMDSTKMKRLPCPMACDPALQPIDPMTMKPKPCPMMSMDQTATLATIVQGLGNHLVYGIGLTGIISEKEGMQIHTELVGSFSFTNREGRSPLFWDVGVTRSIGNKWYFGLMYGVGLTEGSPSHTVMGQLGYAFEHEDKKEEKPPRIEFVLPPGMGLIPSPGGVPPGGVLPPGAAPGAVPPTTQVPPGAGAPPAGVSPAQQAPPGPAQAPPGAGAPPVNPAQQSPAQVPAGAAGPPPKPNTVVIDLPKDWWPEKKEEKKEEKKK